MHAISVIRAYIVVHISLSNEGLKLINFIMTDFDIPLHIICTPVKHIFYVIWIMPNTSIKPPGCQNVCLSNGRYDE